MKKKPLSAAEFAAQLRQDPDYLAKQAQQAKRVADIEAAERRAMDYLASRGYTGTSIQDLVQRYAPIPRGLAEALLDLVGKLEDPNVIESVVRALGTVREDLDPSPLIRLFERVSSENLRWAIANTLAEARPRRAGAWSLRALQESAYGKAREMLLLAAARTNPPGVANPVLVAMLGELPAHAALALAETATVQELPALEQAYANSSGWQREEIGRALSVTRRRLGI